MAETKPNDDMLLSASTSSVLAAEPASPSENPPAGISGGDTEGGVAVGASVWVSGKKINALWSINENRNSWVSVQGVGWVKLANNSDSAIVALTMLGANAKLTQGTVSYRQESDGMVHEIYVW